MLVTLVAGCGARGPVSVEVGVDSAVFHNEGGAWTVYTRCVGTSRTTVGPGYVARVVRGDGVTVTNDVRRRSGLNAPGFGGLGAFGWHGARRHGGTFDYDHAWTIDARNCGEPGVVGARVVDPPHIQNEIGRLTVDVLLADNHVDPRRPIVRVRYRYRIDAHVVHVAITITELCAYGRCGWDGRAFVKEPKLVANINGGGYRRLVVLDADNRLAHNRIEHTGEACVWRGTDAHRQTGQCDDDARAIVRFEGPHVAALNVRMAAVGAPWESGRGLDGWAVASSTRRAYARTDSLNDGIRWSCKARDPANGILRRWELGGGTKDSRGAYRAAAAMFPGWEGGRGYGDCEPGSRVFGGRGESWNALAAYWFDQSAPQANVH